MKKIFALLFSAILTLSLFAQDNVGIGTLTPHPTSILELSSNSKGFLLPRLTASERNAIVSPANGLIVFDTNDNCLYFYKSNNWKSLCDSRFDTITVSVANFDTVFANFATFDSVFAQFASFDSIFSQFAIFDSIFASYANFDTIFSNIIYTDSLVVGGQSLQNIINNSVTNAVNGNAWLQTGNGGTNANNNFLGTTDNQDLAFRTNNTEKVRVTTDGKVGIGTATPNNTAILELNSTDKGLLVPRMTTLQRVSIPFPANGLTVYDTDVRCFFSYDVLLPGWVSMCPEPKGIIVMWSGSISNIPNGYALCDGTNGTPDLRDRFVLSVSSSAENPGATGGANSITLTTAQLPAHSHTGTIGTAGDHTHSGVTASAGDHSHTGNTSTNGNHAHTGNTSTNGNHNHTGTTSTDGAHNHTFPVDNAGIASSGTNADGDNSNDGSGITSTNGAHNHTLNINSNGDHSHTLNINANGDHTHTLNINNAGAHTHNLTINNAGAHSHSLSIDSIGNSQPFDNRPSFYKLAFIIKL